MPVRLVFVLSLIVATPGLGQQANIMQKVDQRYAAHDRNLRPEAAPEVDERERRLRLINQDVQDLSALSASLQSDLQQLQKGFLTKDLSQKLKKMEKLSKRLRQETQQN